MGFLQRVNIQHVSFHGFPPGEAVDCSLSLCTGQPISIICCCLPYLMHRKWALAAFSKNTEGAAARAPELGQLSHKGHAYLFVILSSCRCPARGTTAFDSNVIVVHCQAPISVDIIDGAVMGKEFLVDHPWGREVRCPKTYWDTADNGQRSTMCPYRSC
jgi:hypothetical protein